MIVRLLEALGRININQGNYDEALNLLINAFRLDPRSTRTAYGVSLAAYFMHNYKLVRTIFRSHHIDKPQLHWGVHLQNQIRN